MQKKFEIELGDGRNHPICRFVIIQRMLTDGLISQGGQQLLQLIK